MNEVSDVTKFEERGDIPNAVVVSDSNSPAALTRLALTCGQSLVDIEKMLELQIKYEQNEAKKAYHKAMAKFKANPPKIWRDLQVKYGSGSNATEWSHSDLGVASEAIGRGLGACNLNHTWRTEPKENKETKVTCIITHELGHSEETYLQAGPDTSGSKNALQAIGSTVFYLERYTLFALTGLAPARMDDDGQGAGKPIEYINDNQFSSLIDMMNEVKADSAKFFKFFKIETLDELPAKRFDEAWKMLEAKKK